MLHILYQEVVHRQQGILVGGSIKIKGATQEMPGRICQEKLVGSGHIAAHLEKHAMNMIGGNDQRIIDRIRFHRMFVGHVESIIQQFFQLVLAHYFVADIDTAVKLRKIDINPPGVLRIFAKKGTVFHHARVHRVLKGVGITRFIEYLVFLFREINTEIPFGFGRIGRVAGGNYCCQYTNCCPNGKTRERRKITQRIIVWLQS